MVVENYTKDLKESVYHGAVVNALAVGFTVLGKSLIKLVAIVAISDFTKDYLIKQKEFLIVYKVWQALDFLYAELSLMP